MDPTNDVFDSCFNILMFGYHSNEKSSLVSWLILLRHVEVDEVTRNR